MFTTYRNGRTLWRPVVSIPPDNSTPVLVRYEAQKYASINAAKRASRSEPKGSVRIGRPKG